MPSTVAPKSRLLPTAARHFKAGAKNFHRNTCLWHGDELCSAAVAGRTAANLVRGPLQIALVGSHRVSRRTTVWQHVLSEGALGLLRIALERGANAGAAGVKQVLVRCHVAPAIASALADGVHLAIFTTFGLPLSVAVFMTPLLGRAMAYGGSLVGIGVGFLYGLCIKVPVRWLLQQLAWDASTNVDAGPGRVSNFSEPQLARMATQAGADIATQLPCDVPGWDQVKVHSGNRRDVKRVKLYVAPKRDFVNSAVLGAFAGIGRLGVCGNLGRDITLYAGNLWGNPSAVAQRIMHHEMVHAWQSAHFPAMMTGKASTPEGQQARRMWYEGHAVTYEQLAHPDAKYKPTRLLRLAAMSLWLDPEMDGAQKEEGQPYKLAPEIFKSLRAQTTFDPAYIERTVFENPALAEVLFSRAHKVEVTLPASMAVGDAKVLVDYLWRLNPYRGGHTLHATYETPST